MFDNRRLSVYTNAEKADTTGGQDNGSGRPYHRISRGRKTTFLRRYAAWWAEQGVKVCVLENDFGAVNVDAMLLQDLEAQGVELETISGGCDCDTHQRRMRTKLISMAMRGFERVIVEPSGIFDVDEFFDVLRDEPLDRWYQLGNVIAIVDALLPEELSPQAEYILASESAWAGSVLLSRCQLASDAQKQGQKLIWPVRWKPASAPGSSARRKLLRRTGPI